MSWLLFFSTITLFSYIQALLDIPIEYPIAFILGSISYLYFLQEKCHSLKLITTNSFFICLCIAIATMLHDFSWDGQAYHMEAVRHLINGWNIYHGTPLNNDDSIHSLWLNSYPKATWMYGAALYPVTGSLLSCKSYMLILSIANFLLSRDIVRNYITDKWFGRGVMFALVANPVVCAQFWSTYLDGAMYLACLAISLLLINVIIDGYKRDVIALALVTSMIAYNFKFTAVAYVGIIWLCFSLYILINRKAYAKKVTVMAVMFTLGGLMIIGYNPYVTNFIHGGHPFWPLRGTHDLQDVIQFCGNDEFVKQNRLLKMGESFFAKSSNEVATLENIEYKFPFTIYKTEFKALLSTDCRIGGFGVWFGGILIFSIIATFSIIKKINLKINNGFLWLILFLIGSVVINPESWVARYAPQTYVIPVLGLVMVKKYWHKKRVNIFVNMLLCVVIINSSIIMLEHTVHQLFNEYIDYRVVKKLKNYECIHVWSSGMFETVFDTRFKYHNIKIIRSNERFDGTDAVLRGTGEDNIQVKVVR